jgi:hypothetical protein
LNVCISAFQNLNDLLLVGTDFEKLRKYFRIHVSNMSVRKTVCSPKVKVKVKVKLSLCLTKHHLMKAYWGVDV